MKKAVLMGIVLCFILAVPAIGKESISVLDLNAIAGNEATVRGSGLIEVETPAPDAYARLVCYREKKFAGSALGFTIWMDDVEIADLKNGNYCVIKAAPGEHRLHADEKDDEFTFVVEAGKTYYYRTEIVMGLWKGHGKLAPVEASYGEQEFKKLLPKLKYTRRIHTPELLENPDEAQGATQGEPEQTAEPEQTEEPEQPVEPEKTEESEETAEKEG